MQETWIWPLGWEDPLEKGMATHCNILAWSIPWTKEPGGLESMGSQRVGQGWATNILPPCPSPNPGVHPSSCAFSRWYHPAISSSVVPVSSCPQSLPASGSFQMSHIFIVLAWRIPGTGKPGGLLSMGSHRVRHGWSDLAAAAAACPFLGVKIIIDLSFLFSSSQNVRWNVLGLWKVKWNC